MRFTARLCAVGIQLFPLCRSYPFYLCHRQGPWLCSWGAPWRCPHHAVPPWALGAQGEWIQGGWSLPGAESRKKPHFNLPGSPPTQTPTLPERVGFPLCPRGLSVSSWAFSLVFSAGVTQMLPDPPQWQGNYAPGPAARMPRIYAFQGLLLTWQHMALSSEHLLHLRLLLLPLLLLLLFLLLPRMLGLDRGSPWLPVPFMLDLFILGETNPLGWVGW